MDYYYKSSVTSHEPGSAKLTLILMFNKCVCVCVCEREKGLQYLRAR